ncbi:response regulator [Agrobacterium rosae]|uniref:Response regulator n=1 Tax=Agrobacterium rosae TaxID=1972867 RepID=A0AAW9F7N5_9HYPH|nr:response regulator [Agrobacterium rosae]MDX8301171.1 response regulator [Agrobacterium rosae]POO57633.1 response regulator [Agrobacterium rosae]
MHEAGLTVLVVEDEPIIRFTLTDVLEEAGYTVLEASNVLEAVAIIGKVHTISAVVTDIDMPGGLSGIDLVHMLDTCQQHISVIVTSGGHAPDTLHLPADARFFSKPYHFDDIFFALRAGIAAKAKSASKKRLTRAGGWQLGHP